LTYIPYLWPISPIGPISPMQYFYRPTGLNVGTVAVRIAVI